MTIMNYYRRGDDSVRHREGEEQPEQAGSEQEHFSIKGDGALVSVLACLREETGSILRGTLPVISCE